MKHLIVTGDDFGRNHEVNEAIERCHEAGFLTQASLMVNEPCAEEAAHIAQRHPALCVGLHLTLCDGRASAVSVITDESGRFNASPAAAGLCYAFRPSFATALEQEIRAQFARFRVLGLAPTYWDGHTHLHLHPTVLRLTLPTAIEQGFRAVRLVREPGAPALLPWIMASLSRAAIPALNGQAMTFADHTFGLRDTGRITTQTVARILRGLPEGVSELYFHPGAEPEELEVAPLKALLEAGDITLCTVLPPADGR